MSRIDGPSGPAPISQRQDDDGHGVATVQVGENKLSQVADRLGVDRNTLQGANPEITEGANLRAGQEIRLPRHEEGDSRRAGETASSVTSKYIGETEKNVRRLGGDAPHAPLTDRAIKDDVQSKLSGGEKHLSDADLAQVRGGVQTGDAQHWKYMPGTLEGKNQIKFAEHKWAPDKWAADKWAADKLAPDKWAADKLIQKELGTIKGTEAAQSMHIKLVDQGYKPEKD